MTLKPNNQKEIDRIWIKAKLQLKKYFKDETSKKQLDLHTCFF